MPSPRRTSRPRVETADLGRQIRRCRVSSKPLNLQLLRFISLLVLCTVGDLAGHWT
ncbi:hypothetical protein Ddye_000787 [Dipteronia dyeriana]|uniref:Uncharacterized protein n=1 Tax=Dipteronia dyeriana TaxID=168575 RepID=A0AAD9XNP5_9ROSI|nr:hypothetical protein Ddye_000787 [Dipteronia dyeriana]